MTQEVGAAPQPGAAPYTGPKPDPNRVREELEKYSLGSLKMMGTVRMGGGTDLWALILAPDNVVHRVQKIITWAITTARLLELRNSGLI